MSFKKVLRITGVIVSLHALLITVNVVMAYRNLKNGLDTAFLIDSTVEESPLQRTVLQTGNIKNRLNDEYTVTPPLNLELLGIILGDTATACIKDLIKETEGIYKIGDVISGAKIIDIQQGKVILKIDGRIEILVFSENKEEAITRLSPTERIVSKSAVLREVGGDITKALTMAKVMPQFDFSARKFSGFKIDGIRKDSIVEKSGLVNGDLIRMINGQKLDSPQKAIQVFRKARNQPKIDIDVLRKNKAMRLKYRIKK